MKLKTLLFIAFTVFFLGCTTEKSQLNGTWELVSFKAVVDGEITMQFSGNNRGEQMKSWSDKQFIFVGKFDNGERITPNFGNGTYTLNGNHYEEHINIHTSKSYEGKTVKLYIEFKGDTLIQINPVKDDWTVDKNNCRIEKYIKVE